MPYYLIFLVILTVYWLPYILGNLIGIPFLIISPGAADLAMGVSVCVFSISLMFFLRMYLDRPTMKDYGLTTDRLGSNVFLAVKLFMMMLGVEFIVLSIFSALGISFEGSDQQIDIFFIVSG